MKVKLFISPSEVNEATAYYIQLIRDGLQSVVNDNIMSVDNVDDFSKEDVIVIITLRSYFKVLKKNWKQKVIFWFQGVEPEELALTHIKTMHQKLRIKFFSILEWLALRKCALILFVSDAMRRHFQQKYNYKKNNFIIMPCFNMELKHEAFLFPTKYNKPSFVYAGGILEWQCISEMLILFKAIKKELPQATLTILTKDRVKAQHLVEEAGIQNVTIKFCPLSELPEEMSKYKYGFLLRDDNIINNVATPTKFNTYLALGLIPIVSDVILDFKDQLEKLDISVLVDSMDDFTSTVDKIIALEKRHLTPEHIYSNYSRLFKRYYNPEYYKQQIGKQFLKYLTDKTDK